MSGDLALFWLAMAFLGGVSVWIALRRRRIARHRQAVAEARGGPHFPGTDAFERRLASPDYAGVAEQAQATLPRSLERLYEDVALRSRAGLRLVDPEGRAWEIAHFLPLDPLAFGLHRYGLRDGEVPIARSDSGALYLLAPREGDDRDAPVYRVSEDGDDRERVAHGLDELLTWERSAAGHAGAERRGSTAKSPEAASL